MLRNQFVNRFNGFLIFVILLCCNHFRKCIQQVGLSVHMYIKLKKFRKKYEYLTTNDGKSNNEKTKHSLKTNYTCSDAIS